MGFTNNYDLMEFAEENMEAVVAQDAPLDADMDFEDLVEYHEISEAEMFRIQLDALDMEIGSLPVDFGLPTEEFEDLEYLFSSDEAFKALMNDTGFVEYFPPATDSDDDDSDSDDSDVSNSDDEMEAEPAPRADSGELEDGVEGDSEEIDEEETDEQRIQEMFVKIEAEFARRSQEIRDEVDAKKDPEVFKQFLFEYRRYVARQEHLTLSPDVIRRRVFDFAICRFANSDSLPVNTAWTYVLLNYTDIMGPDLLYLSECYTAVDGVYAALENFTFFGA